MENLRLLLKYNILEISLPWVMETQMAEESEISFLQDFKDKIIDKIKMTNHKELLDKIAYYISTTWFSLTFVAVDKIFDSNYSHKKATTAAYIGNEYTLIRCRKYCFLNGDLLCSVCPFYAKCLRNKVPYSFYLKLVNGENEIKELYNIVKDFLKDVGYSLEKEEKYPNDRLIIRFYHRTLTI